MLCCPELTSGCGSEKSETDEKLILCWMGFFCFTSIFLERQLFSPKKVFDSDNASSMIFAVLVMV